MKSEVEVLREENRKLWDAYLEMDTHFQNGDVARAHKALRDFRKRNAEAKPAEGQADAELKSAFGKVHEYFVQQGWRESAARAEELECDFDNYMRGAYTLDEFFEMAPTLGSGRAQPHLQEAEGRKARECLVGYYKGEPKAADTERLEMITPNWE